VINLQRQPTFKGIPAGTSSRRCNQASFISITTRAGDYDDAFVAESQRLTRLAAKQAILRKKQLREGLTAEEQIELYMPCSHESPRIQLVFGGAALHNLHDQRFKGLDLDDKVTDDRYETAAQFQALLSYQTLQSPLRGEIDIEKRGLVNEAMALQFQQWLPQDKRSLFLSPTHVTSSLRVSPHK
jgi:hypothetical protein